MAASGGSPPRGSGRVQALTRRARAVYFGRLTVLGVAVAAGGGLGLGVAALTPDRFTAIEVLFVVPAPGRPQSVQQLKYAAGVQRVVAEITRARADRQVRMVVEPAAPLIEIDATAGAPAAAVARAGVVAAGMEQAWRARVGATGPRLVRAVPGTTTVRRTAPSAPVDGLVGAVLGGAVATIGAAIRGGWPAPPPDSGGGPDRTEPDRTEPDRDEPDDGEPDDGEPDRRT